MYAKLDVSNNVEKYPYDLPDLRKDNPNVSFPISALSSNDIRDKYKIVEVQNVTKPKEANKLVVEGTPALDGSNWKQTWTLVDFSAEQRSNAVREARLNAYGSAETQLEYLVENGLDAFIARQNDIKAANPKS
jgi:PAB1-binding protein PBP1|tara:strand:+ start:631 stop:1029 length:399 start_codon:yes stop_codon:yes gene_type:complete